MKNLWKNLEMLTADIKNPVELIKEQSEFLSEGTGGVLYISINEIPQAGAIVTKILQNEKINPKFRYKADIASYYLPDYSYNFFALYYDITFYPMLVNLSREIADDISPSGEFPFVGENEYRKYIKVNNQEELESVLGAIFNCDTIRTVLQNMKAIVGDVDLNE